MPVKVIEDTTRSGKAKRRLSASQTKTPFNVSMMFSRDEYIVFKSWFANTTKYGLLSFGFPKIDGNNPSDIGEYRFVADSSIRTENLGGLFVKCTMQWEEV